MFCCTSLSSCSVKDREANLDVSKNAQMLSSKSQLPAPCSQTPGNAKTPSVLLDEIAKEWKQTGLERNIATSIDSKLDVFKSSLERKSRKNQRNKIGLERQFSTTEHVFSLDGQKLHPNEDRYVICNSFDSFQRYLPDNMEFCDEVLSQLERMKMYAVIDGHGGSACAEYIKESLPLKVIESGYLGTEITANSLLNALESAILTIEEQFLKVCKKSKDSSGAVLVAALELDGWLCVSNVGDSEAVLINHQGRRFSMTSLHSSNNLKEMRRVSLTGASVHNGYIMNKLKPSRTIGDHDVKEITQTVILAKPESHVYRVQRRSEGRCCCVLASDGFWDIGKRKAMNFISKHINFWQNCKQNNEMDKYAKAGYIDPAKAMAEFARTNGSRDDITVLFVQF